MRKALLYALPVCFAGALLAAVAVLADMPETVSALIAALCVVLTFTAAAVLLTGAANRRERELAEKLEQIEARAESASRYGRSNIGYMARAAQEFRAPMNAIIGMAELITMEESLPPVVYEHANGIRRMGADLLAVASDIADYSLIELGQMEPQPAEYVLTELINEVAGVIRVRLADKPVIFTISLDPKLPVRLYGDRVRIKQVLLHLLGNAVMYTIEGQVALVIRGEIADGADSVELTLEVKDTGIGIRETDLCELFSDETKLGSPVRGAIVASGLGLVISRRLCAAMGGALGASSVYGEGSTFTMTLPQGVRSGEAVAVVERPEDKTVLLYESRDISANALMDALNALGVPFRHARSRTQFQNAFRIEDNSPAVGNRPVFPFVFVAPLMLEDARRFLSQRNDGATLIVLAGYGENFWEQGIRSLILPAHEASIAELLNDTGSANTQSAARRLMPFTAADTRILIVDDVSANLRVADSMLQGSGIQTVLCKSGAEAVDMAQKNKYDLILMDHMMPGMNGIEAALQIRARQDGASKDVPIVAMTASHDVRLHDELLRNGMNGILIKPIDAGALGMTLSKWIQGCKTADVPPVAPENDGALWIEGVDTQEGLKRAGGDMRDYLDSLELYCRESAETTAQMTVALAEKNYERFRAYLNTVISASEDIGAYAIAEQARMLVAGDKDSAHAEAGISGFRSTLDALLYNVKPVLDKRGNSRARG